MKFADVKIDECYVYLNPSARYARLDGQKIYPLANQNYMKTYKRMANETVFTPFKRGDRKPYDGSTGLPVLVLSPYGDGPTEEQERILRELTIEDLIANKGKVPEAAYNALRSLHYRFEMIQVGYINETWENYEVQKRAEDERRAVEREALAKQQDEELAAMDKAAEALNRLLGSKVRVERNSFGNLRMSLDVEQAKALADLARVIMPRSGD